MNRRSFISQATFLGLSVPATKLWGGEAYEDYEKLVILHTNDTHSRIEPFESGEYKGMGGVLARKTAIDAIRKEEDNVLLLDAGDIFQGTPYFNLFSGELEMKAMSMLGYDAGTMGNHDFDLGMENFAKQSNHAHFPFINCNYDVSRTALSSVIKPYVVLKRGRIRIGILGLGIDLDGLVPYSHFQDLIYKNPIQEAQKYANILKYDERCDIVIALSHLGYDYSDKTTISDILLSEFVENIDIILGGHTHTFLKCPKITQKGNNKNVLINQVGFGGINLGKIELYFNRRKNQIEKKEGTIIKCLTN